MNKRRGGSSLITRSFCYCCMRETDFEDNVCKVCGYELNSGWHPSYMKPGTELHSRYIVGMLIGVNGEGANYIGFDKDVSRRVLIREFMPKDLCARVKGKALIGVSYNHLAEYKALMAEYTELNKSLARNRSLVHVNTVLDMFAENNTTYVVSEYVEGITLTEYLKENAGELTWKKVSQIFPGLFNTLSSLHKSGIIHRGLCPDTIYITGDNEFRLTGFSISAIRTKGAELEPEIFDGYAAPEQYSVSNRQGTWTDVYAVCAILYRILTGCKPIDAMSRMDKDNLTSPSELNENIPKYVSSAIMRGMNLLGNDRIQTIDELSSCIFNPDTEFMNEADEFTSEYNAQPYTETNTFDAYNDYNNDYNDEYNEPESEYIDGYQDDYSYEGERKPEKRQSTADRMKVPVVAAVILLAVMLVAVFFVVKALDKGGSSNKEETTSNTESTAQTSEPETASEQSGDSVMPNLVGSDYETSSSYYSGWFTLSPEYDYSDDYEEGEIMWQEVEPDELFTSGATIKVKVSQGSRYIELPSYSGEGYTSYKKKLDELGIPSTYSGRTDTGYSDGTVVGLSVDDGEKYDRKSGETITIYYAYTPETEPPTEAPTEAPQTDAPTDAPADTPTDAPQQDAPVDDNGGGDANAGDGAAE